MAAGEFCLIFFFFHAMIVTSAVFSSGFADGVVDHSEIYGRPPRAKDTSQSSRNSSTGTIYATGLDVQKRQTSKPYGGPRSGMDSHRKILFFGLFVFESQRVLLFVLFQRVLRSNKERKTSAAPEDPAQKRKGSIFTDLLSKNRKASAVPNEVAQNPKVYTVPEANTRARKGSTFTDLLSRNKKFPAARENESLKSASGARKPSIIMEEVSGHLRDVSAERCLQLTDGHFMFAPTVR